MRSAYQPDCCICCFPLPRACFLFVLLKCCETDAEVSASKRCGVIGSACSVFGRRMSPSGPAGENLTSTAPPVLSLHCLNLSSVLNLMLTLMLTVADEFSPPGSHGDPLVLSVQVLPVYQSRVLTCVLPRGSRVFVQACVCSSDI